MKNVISVFFIIIITLSLNAQNISDFKIIEVTGTAEMEIIPDKIQITISVNDKDFKTKQTFDDFEKQIIGKLNEIGVSVENEFSVMNMNSSLKVSIIGKDNMFSTRQYIVVVHDTEKANMVFKEMGEIGITTIAITNFDHSEIDKYRLQVKVNAIKAAKDKALALTGAIGQTIGPAVHINEISYNAYQPNVYANVMYKEKMMSDFDEIEKVNFQKIKLSYSVLVKFELK